MSTKTTTTNTAAFNGAGMSGYNTLQPTIQSALQQNITNPWTAMAGNQQMAAGNQSIFGQSQQNFQGIAQSLQQRGISANSPLFAQQLNQQRNATQKQQGNMYSNLLLNAQNLSTQSATAASQYTPLQTGSTTTGTVSGLGTWLPQLAAAAAKASSGAAGA
jgi:hypothetical protein